MPKQEQYYTPVGKVKFPKTIINSKEYPYIFIPDVITEEDETQWKFSLSFDPKDGDKLLRILDAQHAEIKNANFQPYKADKDKLEDGSIVDNGLIAINFTSGYPIHMVDASKKECSEKVGWGSKIRVKFTTKPVNNKGKVGLGRYVRAIQIIELSESGMDLSGFDATPTKDEDRPWEE